MIPTLVASGDNGFAKSFSALMNGISPMLGQHIACNWRYDSTESDILEWVNDFYDDGKIHGKLASDIYDTIQATWLYEDD